MFPSRMQLQKKKKKNIYNKILSQFISLHFFTFYSLPRFLFSFFFVQDRHVKRSGGDVEPVVDPSQDYVLMLGYENATHTVMRFKRKLETCDTSYDMAITVSSWRFF